MKYGCFIKNKLMILSAICLSSISSAGAMDKMIELSVFSTGEKVNFVSNAEKAEYESNLSENQNCNTDKLYNLLKQLKSDDLKKFKIDVLLSNESWEGVLSSNMDDKLLIKNQSPLEGILLKKNSYCDFFKANSKFSEISEKIKVQSGQI